jgi:hypothetical protein
MFEGMALELAKVMPIDKVATMMKENYHTIMRIVDKYIVVSKASANYSEITK